VLGWKGAIFAEMCGGAGGPLDGRCEWVPSLVDLYSSGEGFLWPGAVVLAARRRAFST
jgi:hypothetical protein